MNARPDPSPCVDSDPSPGIDRVAVRNRLSLISYTFVLTTMELTAGGEHE
jgi:hypothetical protein